jgi:uncharacterized protein involved in response to NO
VFALVTLAAVLRPAAPIRPGGYGFLPGLCGTAWNCGFGLFVILFARLLCAPRQRAHKAV